MALDERDQHLFISVRVWTKEKVGQWWPSPKGVSVRLSEAEDVAGALTKALDPEEASTHGS